MASSSEESSSRDEPNTPLFSNRLTKDERTDLVSALEHVVAVGSHFHNLAQRENKWRRRQASKPNSATLDKQPFLENVGRDGDHDRKSDDDDQSSIEKADGVASRLLHAEDYRILGNKGFVGEDVIWNWPQDKPGVRKRIIDNDWDEEHGDGIHILDFSDARLSRATPRDAKRRKAQLDRSDVTVADNRVPRALVQRCWARAVHAASCTMFCNETPTAAAPQPRSPKKNRNQGYAEAVIKCSQLGIQLPSEGPFQCPVCKADFESSEPLRLHFFGGRKQLGCCWELLRSKQRDMIDKVLDGEVVALMDGLLHTLLSCAKHSTTVHDNQGGERSKQFDWKDVIHFLDCTLSSSDTILTITPPPPTVHSVWNTVKMRPAALPVVLNKQVMDVVSRRLVERYADVPR